MCPLPRRQMQKKILLSPLYMNQPMNESVVEVDMALQVWQATWSGIFEQINTKRHLHLEVVSENCNPRALEVFVRI